MKYVKSGLLGAALAFGLSQGAMAGSLDAETVIVEAESSSSGTALVAILAIILAIPALD